MKYFTTIFTIIVNIIVNFSFCFCDDVIVQTNSGQVLGKISQNRKGGDFYSFQGIPYAKPPVDDLRFKAPEPVEPWGNLWNATYIRSKCTQDVIKGDEVTVLGQEDCLYLNIYTPKISNKNDDTLLPVMVFIHGGSFRKGCSGGYGPEFILTENVVLAAMNYRLGILGFLNFENDKLGVPGNAGLKDQALAMKWIKENIKYFGGNPDDITLFGESAGSASVHLHMLSPMSKGLFNKAIAQSGVATNFWVIAKDNTGKILGETLNKNVDNEEMLLEELQKASLPELMKAQVTMFDADKRLGVQQNCCVVVEHQNGGSTFLDQKPIDILNSGNFNQVPLMLGYNSQEGMFFEMTRKQSTGNFFTIEDFETNLPYSFYEHPEKVPEIAEKVKKLYLAAENEKFYLQPSINYVTDIYFYYNIYQAALKHVEIAKEPVYFYRFSADTKMNLMKRSIPELIEYPGACHGDDIGYLFKIQQMEIEPNSIEDIGIDRMVRMWTNFAIHGNPTPKKDALLNDQIWQSLSGSDGYILEIGNQINKSSNPDVERYKFWEDIHEMYL